MKIREPRKNGFVLFGALLISLVFIVVIIPLISWTANEYSWTTRSYMRMRALNLADAGAENGIWEIMYNGAAFAAWGGSNPKTLAINSFKDSGNNTIGDIETACLQTSSDNYLITSTGYVPSKAGQKVKKTVKVKVFPHALFNNAVFGVDSVSVTGIARIDSYNSADGVYDPAMSKDNADVGTNGALTISGNSLIKGNVFIGPDGSVSGNDPSHVTGETYYSGNPVEIEPAALPDYFASLPSQGSLNLSGSTEVVLPAGNYYYDSISLSSKAVLRLNAGVKLYVGNDFSVSGQASVFTGAGIAIYVGGSGNFAGGGIVNTGGYPNDLQIYGLGSGTSLNFGGGSSFYGTVYAPGSDVLFSGTSDYFGAVVAKSIEMSGTFQFHYDESLAVNGPTSGYDIAYWQED